MGAPGQLSGAQSMANMIAQNRQLRAALLGSAPRMRKNLGNFTVGGAPGQTSRIKLFNVGITTKIVIDVNYSIDVGTAIATLSPKAPFNLMNRVKLTDYDGTDRINCSGYQLWVLQCIRERVPYGYNNGSQTAVLTSPLTPVAIATDVGRFQIEIPLAYDPDGTVSGTPDLRGALLSQTAVGEAWINIDWNNLLVQNANADAYYNGAPTSTAVQTALTTFNVNVFQEYLLPQRVGNDTPIPLLDLMTVYEVAGMLKSSDNLAANAEKLLNYPNVRSVIGAYFNYVNNGVMNPATTDIVKFKLVANGNNVLREYLPADKLFDQRIAMVEHADLRPGTYFELHRDKPIETALFGNVQYSITPSVVTNTTYPAYIEVCYESFYTKGSALPGLSQASG